VEWIFPRAAPAGRLGGRVAEDPLVKLYSGPLSLFTAKVRIALGEKGLDYERIEVGWSLESRYQPHHPDVVALNPKAQVPVLVDGDLAVYDSTQIFEYLEDRYPEPALYPADVAGRARCRRLEAAADELFFPALWELIDGSFYPAQGGGRDEARLAGARAALAREYERLEAELQGRAYLCGGFTVADVASFVFANAASALGAAPDPGQRALQAWVARVGARPAVRREVDETRRFLAETFAQPRGAEAAAPAAPPAG
jgi:glutathione S-transferase